MASTADHIAARSDADLLARIIAAAEQAGVPNAQAWAQVELGRFISVNIGTPETPSTIADVHAYAKNIRDTAVRALPPAPGLDPAAVTDAHLLAAVALLTAPATEPTPPDNEGNPA